ncbi:alkaline phosphatase Pho8 [Aspergillus rambellii]|uniref:Alkaline phosphatase n=1 Tax=Aspergillus rambellii TaxID=308745 RepID=A0A0F8UXF8_9EURO|nr:alkaline phosphatase Pho8 [Aspergillus rambellii]
MIPRAHPAKPRSHDRGPPSKEDTQTDFAALNVLGNIPAPTTAVDACLDSGFHLDNGVKITGGDGVLLVGGEAFAWKPWAGKEGGRDTMVNKKGQFEVDEQVWGILGLVWPRPEPLLAPRPSSDHSSIRNAEEEDALLTGERTNRTPQRRGWSFWKEVGLFAWALIATAAVIVLAVVYQHESNQAGENSWGPSEKPTGKRNLIFMVSDGMGPTSLTMTRGFKQLTQGLAADDILVLDNHIIGTSRTRSSSSLVTDSAAGATAFSCGFKSYNGAISVLPDHSPCGTVLEAAALAGYKTGLVVTTRITDATPACFASHVNLRQYEDRIAEQEIGEHPLGRVVDLILGGGRCHFLPNTTSGSCRGDDRDLVAIAKEKGFSYIDDRAGFNALNNGKEAQLPLLGLLAEKDIPFEIDRRTQDDVYPSLEEMARTALKILSEATADSDKGFFLMIEGSRIDHAGHGNDPAAQVREVLAYDKAFAAVLEFLEQDSTPGVLVGTSDHETGGLAAARQLSSNYPQYLWLPGVLANASHSAEYAGRKLNAYLSSEPSASAQRQFARELLETALGVTDATESEVDALIDRKVAGGPAYVFADIISRRAQIGWSTHGHSSVDVNIYASSVKDAWRLQGNHENTEVGNFLADYLGLDIEAVTKRLQESAYWSFTDKSSVAAESPEKFSWLGDPLGEDVRTEGLDTYHGEFKKRSTVPGVEGQDCGCGRTH